MQTNLPDPSSLFYQLSKELGLNLPDIPPVSLDSPSHIYKTWLGELNHAINDKLLAQGQSAPNFIADTVRLRTLAVDVLLIGLFGAVGLPDSLSLFAVGGYGRGELFPCSDVDLLLLGDVENYQQQIGQFVTLLWDIGLEPAFSPRTPAQLADNAQEHTIATALLESRFLTGSREFIALPRQALKQTWTAGDFYHAKLTESKQRHLANNATEYNLEPNIKNGVGTLRDLHILGWLGKFYFDDVHSLADLVKVGFIAPLQYERLHHALNFLWCVRHHLHTLADRHEDRLGFEWQKGVAKAMGYTVDDTGKDTQGLEHLMRLYYRHVMQVASLSELLCDYFFENYLNPTKTHTKIDDDFYQVSLNDDTPKIAIAQPDLFSKKPETLLKIFLVMGQVGINKISANTLTQLSLSAHLIDDAYRTNPAHQALFLANLQENNYLFHRLRLMKRHGILERYIPAFGQIMGLMQYDLFHRYTVDAHTLLLVRILHRLSDPTNETYQQKFDLVSEVYQQIHRKDILVIAALFHDIAKGRGGDHSQLGAVDAYEFCVGHGMSVGDSEFVAWLVREHLTMSLTAQKQDIYDPDVIKTFAKLTGTTARLNHLYVLTVADMNATNSQLWNNWRASLLKRLYHSTHRVLTFGEHIIHKDRMIDSRKRKAKALLAHDDTAIENLWQDFGEEYFLTQKYVDIAWQIDEILTQKTKLPNTPIIALKAHSDLALDAVSLFICVPDKHSLFSTTVCVLDKLGLSVLDANILTADIDDVACALDSYVLIDRFSKRDKHGSLMSDFLTNQERQHELINALSQAFERPTCVANGTRFGFDRSLRHFNVPTVIEFSQDTGVGHDTHHRLSLVTKDRASLLATIGGVFDRLGVEVHGARITTMGERAEDMFYISDQGGEILSVDKLDKLKGTLLEILS